MKQKAIALITTGAIVLSAASPAFAGNKNNFKKYYKNRSDSQRITQNFKQKIKVFQKGYKNVAKINANINFGGW